MKPCRTCGRVWSPLGNAELLECACKGNPQRSPRGQARTGAQRVAEHRARKRAAAAS